MNQLFSRVIARRAYMVRMMASKTKCGIHPTQRTDYKYGELPGGNPAWSVPFSFHNPWRTTLVWTLYFTIAAWAPMLVVSYQLLLK